MKKKRKDKPKIQSTIGKKTYNKYTVCDKKRVALLMESYKKDYDAELAAKPAEYDPKKKTLNFFLIILKRVIHITHDIYLQSRHLF